MKRGFYLHTYQPYGRKERCVVIFTQTVPMTLVRRLSPSPSRAIVVVDTNIRQSFIRSVIKLLRTTGTRDVDVYRFTHGKKNLTNLVPIWQRMVGVVPDMVVGVGGGTVSDIAGFAASTYQRGIPHILFPTTTLGMADASLGGKTAIDFHGVKNCIGALHYPPLVVNVMESLESLPDEEFRSGFSEMVKAAVLFDSDFFEQMEKLVTPILARNPLVLLRVIQHSALLKMHNSEDPPAHKIKLLYGHAVGHALEIIEAAHLRHGDAVSIGMTIEGAIACLLGVWNLPDWERQTKLFCRFGLPLYPPKTVSSEQMIKKMDYYKKLVTPNTFAFVFPRRIGTVARGDGTFLTYIQKRNFGNIYRQALAFVENYTQSL